MKQGQRRLRLLYWSTIALLPINDLLSFAYANVLWRQGAARGASSPGLRHYMAIPLCQGTDLAVIAECFTCNTLTERTVITFTQGKFKRRTICAFAPKWNFFVTVTINIIWTMWQTSRKATFVLPSNIERCRRYYSRKMKNVFAVVEINGSFNETKKQPLRARGYW